MLLSQPKILRDNPECYKVEHGKGYVPTEIATEEEKKAIAEFNKKWHKGRQDMVRIEE